MLKSKKKTLKGYFKVTLNMSFKEKQISMMTKKLHLCNRLFVSNRNFTTKHVKIVKNSRFFKDFCSKFQVFPGKVATLFMLEFKKLD